MADIATHDAWIVGTHDLSDAPESVQAISDAVADGLVVVFDRSQGAVVIMDQETYVDDFEWADE